VKELLRRSLRGLGYDLHRFLPVLSPDAQLGALLRHFEIDLVFDVGANTGQYGAHLRGLGYAGELVSFEPLPDAHQALTRAAAGDPRWQVAPRAAIGNQDGEITINIAGNSASSSLLDMLDEHRTAAPESAYVGTATAPIQRLDTVAPAWLAAPRRLLLKIDTQGYQDRVLAGGPATIAAAAAVQLEVSLAPLYAGQPSFETLGQAMAGHGLVLWALWPGFADPASGRILQIEAIYARPA